MTDEQKPSTGRSLTPLWVISLFVSLTEAVLGIGVIQTNGAIQIALTVFVIVFPLLVAGGFFTVLWNKPYVFYSPTEYGQQNVREYVEAMQRRVLNEGELYNRLRQTIRSTLTSDEIIIELSDAISRVTGERLREEIVGNVTKIMDSIAERTMEGVRKEGFITVDARPLLGTRNGKIWQIPYGQFVTVSDFLDNLWYLLQPYGIPSMRYGELWALRDTKTGKVLRDMGRRWAHTRGQTLDTRSLSDVGITPGMKLEAIPLSR